MIEFFFMLFILVYLLAVILIFNDCCIRFRISDINNFTISILLFVPMELLILYGIIFDNFFLMIVGGIVGCAAGYCIVDCIISAAILIWDISCQK